MAWQQLVADVGLEVDENGKPYYREVWVTVPRQNGKTTLVLVWELDRCLNWGEPQRVLYSAQNGSEAAKKLITEQAPLLQRSPLSAFVKHIYRANGAEAIALDTGSRIDILRDADSAGHGKTLDLAVIDEAFSDTDDRREQAAIPAMNTRPKAQILGLSTAGTETSVLLERKRDLGRQAVAEDWDRDIAYFEWAAPEDADADDEATWWACMPALGVTIDVDAVRHARKSMSDGEFRRAYLNQWVPSDDRLIPVDLWERACQYATKDCSFVAIDVTDRPAPTASIALADASGTIELQDCRPGTSWAVREAVRLAKQYRCPVGLDPHSPAGTVATELEREGVKVVPFTNDDMTHAAHSFLEAALDGTLRVQRHYMLDEAAAVVRKRTSGDRFYFGRNASTTPLIAASIARRMASRNDTKALDWYVL